MKWTMMGVILFFGFCGLLNASPIPVHISFSGDEKLGREIVETYRAGLEELEGLVWSNRPSQAQWVWYISGLPTAPSDSQQSIFAFSTVLLQTITDAQGQIHLAYEKNKLRIVTLEEFKQQTLPELKWLQDHATTKN